MKVYSIDLQYGDTVNSVISHKQFSIAILVISTLLITGALYSYLRLKPAHLTSHTEAELKPDFNLHRQEIKGLTFQSVIGGKKILTIKADRFSIQKKKVGFFRFALASEAHFKNAHIKFYETGMLFNISKGSKNAYLNPTGNNTSRNLHENDIDLRDLLSKMSIASLPVKRITGIVCKPVQVELYDGETMITRILADSATMNRKKQVVFKGRVTVTSSNRSLTSNHITFIPQKGMLKVEKSFLFKIDHDEKRGKYLKTDLLLNTL